MRDNLSGTVNELKYGATYYPTWRPVLTMPIILGEVIVNVDGSATTLEALELTNNALFNQTKNAIAVLYRLSCPLLLLL